jgi:hypothetical protein
MDDAPCAQSPIPDPPPAVPVISRNDPVINEKKLAGFKYFQGILPLLDRLHDQGCARDKAHNRPLHYDQYAALLLLFFFNPIVTSMRGLVEASKLEKVRRKLGVLEILFRFFKQVLGCRHLLSHREDGIKIQVYMAIIACMLITLHSGRQPTLRTLEMLQFYFSGWASEAELEAHIAKLKKQD